MTVQEIMWCYMTNIMRELEHLKLVILEMDLMK